MWNLLQAGDIWSYAAVHAGQQSSGGYSISEQQQKISVQKLDNNIH
jgi:hypothetical protein